MNAQFDPLYEKLKALPPQRRAEVEDFVDFLFVREARSLPAGSARRGVAAIRGEGGLVAGVDVLSNKALLEAADA